ncbi:iron ABC transporter permease [Paenibacillus motobuensis]|uniref:ABC transporter permease n=1 Tax=Paenibacillus TaxID=44249 RepID=UPI0020424DE0|nr:MULTISPECIES: iron ABC transporter permease [Paenibacillus]MCM3038407.1 iron ABC transporter permease [Paenibacillus lutimineralis]MCM3645511.1 iron ABC transporter permease [Paenibacillus motobuensis]
MESKLTKSPMRLPKKFNIGLIGFLVILGWFIIAFMIIPNLEILKTVFFSDGGFSSETIGKIFNSERAMRGIKNSFLLAFTLTITTSVVGILEVLFLDYFKIKGKWFLTLCYMIPLIFGGIMLANGYLFTYGSRGFVTKFLVELFPNLPVNWFSGYGAVLFLMTFACTTNYMIFFRNSFKSIDYQTIEAAKGLGASNFTVLIKVVLPALKPILLTCIILLFQTGLMAMSAPLMVGGQEFETISPLILTFTERPTSRALAAVLSLFLGLFQLVLLFVIQRNEKKGNYLSVSKVKTRIQPMKINSKIWNFFAHVLAYVFALINLLPLVVVALFSFTNFQTISTRNLTLSSFSLQNYVQILTDSSAYLPFVTSVVYSAIAAIVAVVLMTIAARIVFKYRNRSTELLEFLLHIPWVLPGLMFALGLVLSYSKPKWIIFNQPLTGTLVIMLVAYIVVMLPNTFRFLKASYFSVDQNLEDAAKNLGAKPIYSFVKIVLPIILPTVLAMLAINFNGKLGDYDLSVFLYNPAAKPVGVVIRSNSNPEAGIEGIAINFVYSVLLMIINALVFFFVYADGKERIASLFKRKKEIKQ